MSGRPSVGLGAGGTRSWRGGQECAAALGSAPGHAGVACTLVAPRRLVLLRPALG